MEINTFNNNQSNNLLCKFCGVQFYKSNILNKHKILCELKYHSVSSINKTYKFNHITSLQIKNQVQELNELNEEHLNYPSNKKLFKMLIELNENQEKMQKKINTLYEKVKFYEKLFSKKQRQKINIITYLNNSLNLSIKPYCQFEYYYEYIKIEPLIIDYLFSYSFYDTLLYLFKQSLFKTEHQYNKNYYCIPIICCKEYPNNLYVYINGQNKWCIIDEEKFIKFLNNLYIKIFKTYRLWKKNNELLIENDEKLQILIDKTTKKIMNVELKKLAPKLKKIIYENLVSLNICNFDNNIILTEDDNASENCGVDGVDSVDGVNGVDGLDGVNGVDSVDSVDGVNGVDGVDGVDGFDGVDDIY